MHGSPETVLDLVTVLLVVSVEGRLDVFERRELSAEALAEAEPRNSHPLAWTTDGSGGGGYTQGECGGGQKDVSRPHVMLKEEHEEERERETGRDDQAGLIPVGFGWSADDRGASLSTCKAASMLAPAGAIAHPRRLGQWREGYPPRVGNHALQARHHLGEMGSTKCRQGRLERGLLR